MQEHLKQRALEWLSFLVSTPSFSRAEQDTADYLERQIRSFGLDPLRSGHNIWIKTSSWDEELPTILLCSHHDTVKPASGWTEDPFGAKVSNGKLIGLGSNDAGASLVALMATFLFFEHKNEKLPFNLVFAAVAEEEISGKNGVSSILPELGSFDLAVIGEPTQMQMAVAEKGLMVIDGETIGKSGHAAREEGINALYLALDEIQKIRELQFPDKSDLLGPVKLTVTQIQAGSQHNVVPDKCTFVIDVRTNECYSNEEAFNLIQSRTNARLKARSYRLNSSRIPLDHPIVRKGAALGLTCFGSPTLSDQALISGPTVKIGCGDSARSHTANEFIYLVELNQGIDTYIQLLDHLKL